MRPPNWHRLAVGLSACLLSLGATITSQQLSPGQDGLLSSEMTLDARTLRVRFAPALRAENREYQAVFAPAVGASDSRVYVGYLESDAALRIHTLEIPGRYGARLDLWITVTSDGWQLHVTDSRERGAAVPGSVRLSHATRAVVAPTFAAALITTGTNTGLLVMRWGEHEWTTDVEVSRQPRDPRERSDTVAGNDGVPDLDVDAFVRAQRFSTRNETALVLPDGQRISVLFPKALSVAGRDFSQIGSTRDGTVVHFTAGAVTRLKTDVPLRFWQTTVDTGNVAPDFAGTYGLWLRRAGPGWRLAFNNEPDAWGTQHDPALDTAEVELDYSRGGAPSRPFAVALVPTGAERGRLVMHWGSHEWFADFVVDR